MRRVFTQLICVLLLFCLLINISGLFLIFCYRQQEVKWEMKQYLSRNLQHASLTVFAFSLQDKKNINWEANDEFSFQGQMYDVIKELQLGDTTIVYCVPDSKETALIKSFLQQSEKQAPLKEKNSLPVQLLSTPYLVAEPNTGLHFAPLKLLHHTQYAFFLPYAEQVILTPPPQVVC